MADLHYRIGDATDPQPLRGEPMVIVHCCNDQGAWGAGFSGALSRRYPGIVEEEYRAWGARDLGAIQVVKVSSGLWVCNLIGQNGYQEYNWKAGAGPRWHHPFVRYWAIRKGLRRLRDWAMTWVPPSVHCPRLGCGLAGGRWEEIEPILQEELVDRGIDVVVYDLPVGVTNTRPR